MPGTDSWRSITRVGSVVREIYSPGAPGYNCRNQSSVQNFSLLETILLRNIFTHRKYTHKRSYRRPHTLWRYSCISYHLFYKICHPSVTSTKPLCYRWRCKKKEIGHALDVRWWRWSLDVQDRWYSYQGLRYSFFTIPWKMYTFEIILL